MYFRVVARETVDSCRSTWPAISAKMSGRIASGFVGHHPPGFSALALAETAEKAFDRPLIAAMLEKNINDIAILIDRPIQIVSLSLNGDKDVVEMPPLA